MNAQYVHGYNATETQRLHDQASTLADLLHSDTAYSGGDTVLEAGCGVGAQTVTLARTSPEASITSVDVAGPSVAKATHAVESAGLNNVTFHQADIFHLPFARESFDHVFVCFVLEHLHNPVEALWALQRVLKAGGSITVIEGDHGSAYFHPDNALSRKAIWSLVDLQARGGGDALIGRTLYPLLCKAGLEDVRVSPRMVYADATRPDLVDGFTQKTFAAMIEGVREEATAADLMTEEEFDKGVAGLYRAAEPDGVFCYTFFKAVGIKGSDGEDGL